MRRLSLVLEALRREVEAGLGTAATGSSPVRAIHVTASLPWRVEEDSSSAQNGASPLKILGGEPWIATRAAAGENAPSSVLTVEFWIGAEPPAPLAAKAVPLQRESASTPLPVPMPAGFDPDQVSGVLAEVLGPPGFDSAARATVLQEALEGLSPEPLLQALTALHQPTPSSETAEVKRVRHRLRGILVSGPMHHAGRGGERMKELIQAYGIAAIVTLLRERWKTQQEWLDESD